MKITIDTDVLKQEYLTLEEFLALLLGYYNVNYEEAEQSLIKRNLIQKNLFAELPPILSNNTKNLVLNILLKSDDKVKQCGIKDFTALAKSLQNCFPEGNKPGTSYSWRGDINDIVQRLMVLVVRYKFDFTEKEAIEATEEYVKDCTDHQHMSLLRNFIYTNRRNASGDYDFNSMFMTIIENNREQK